MKKIVYVVLAFAFFLSACQKDDDIVSSKNSAADYNHGLPLIWNQLFLEIERYCPGYRPPVSARNYGYVNLIAYEAVVHGSNLKYKSFSGHFPGLQINPPHKGKDYNWEVCLNAAYEHSFELFFPTAPAEQQFRMLEISNDLRSSMQANSSPDVYQRSKEYGQYVAQTIYDWSKQDEWGHEAYLHNFDNAFTPPTGEGYWKPTYPDYAPALLPHWGKVRTFAALPNDGVPPPPAFSTVLGSQLHNEALETYNLVNEVKAGQKPEEYWIAEFWSDDCPILTFTPSGRWVSIANQIIARERPNMLETVVTYAKLGMALSDAGVKCWKEKYHFNMLRPIDYIRTYMNAPDWNTVMCPDGSGRYYTPNFPSYPSGHATFSGASAYVLESIFGKNYHFTDRSHEGRTEFRSTPRSFTSIVAMAEENAYSRMPLGVHFASDSDAGLNLGYLVGERVVKLPWQ